MNIYFQLLYVFRSLFSIFFFFFVFLKIMPGIEVLVSLINRWLLGIQNGDSDSTHGDSNILPNYIT